MTSLLTSAATEIQSPSLVSGPPAVAAAGHIRCRDVPFPSGRKTRLIWWCERENGWTPCRGHEHLSPDTAVRCWNAHFLSAQRS